MGRPFTITRTTTVAANPEVVHGLVDDFHEWAKWSPWEGRAGPFWWSSTRSA